MSGLKMINSKSMSTTNKSVKQEVHFDNPERSRKPKLMKLINLF